MHDPDPSLDPVMRDDVAHVLPGAESASFAGHTVVDDHGERVGTVADVISDPSTLEPEWLVVDMGALKASHYVPVAGTYRRDDGEVVVPYPKDVVKHAPKAKRDHVLDPGDDRALRTHYGLTA